jgi:hypothetical protein
MARTAKTATKVSRSNTEPVRTRFQVRVRGSQFFVVDVETGATVAGPYVHRTRAQHEADKREAAAPRRRS